MRIAATLLCLALAVQAAGEVLALNELHRQHREAVMFEDLVHTHDVGMLQVRDRLGFQPKSRKLA